jgi:hypothetical protein
LLETSRTDDDNFSQFLLVVAVVINQLIAAYIIIFDDVLTKFEERRKKRRQRELTTYKKNLSVRYATPATNLVLQFVLNHLLADENRAYIKKHTQLHAWQFLMLAERVKDLIERPRL